MEVNRKKRAFVNTSIRVVGTVVTLAGQLVAMTVLSRLLPIEAHGVVAYAVVFVSLADRASQLGVGPTLVQIPDLTSDRIRVGFTLSLIMGAIAWAVLFFIVPEFIVGAQRQLVLRVLSFIFFFMGMSVVSGAILQREHRFKEIVLAELAAFLSGHIVIGIGLALLGFGMWSLVAAVMTNSVLRSFFLWSRARHSLRPLMRLDDAKRLVKFGSVLTVTQLLNFGAVSSDSFLVGRLGGDHSLGLYAKAIQLVRLPARMITRSMNAVLFPILSRVDDPTVVRRGYYKSIMLATTFMVPIAVVAYVTAPELVGALFGPTWLGAVVPLKILAPVAVLTTYSLGDAVLVARDKLRIQLFVHATFFVTVVTACWLLFHRFGMPGVAYGVFLANAVTYLLMMGCCRHVLGGTVWELVRSQIPAAILLVACGALCIGARSCLLTIDLPTIALLLTEMAVCLLIFAIVFLSPIPGPQRECQELAFQYGETMVGKYPIAMRYLNKLKSWTVKSVS